MLEAVAEADVVITNPEHFAVALAYDPSSDDPPRVVAKGADFTAQRIRERAAEEACRCSSHRFLPELYFSLLKFRVSFPKRFLRLLLRSLLISLI